MRVLFLDCSMGMAGDMLLSALLELSGKKEEYIDRLNKIGIPGVVYKAEKSIKCGITGTHVKVLIGGEEEKTMDEKCEHEHEHTHSHIGLGEIEKIINNLNLKQGVKDDVLEVYRLIAEAESKVHGVPVSEVHFHEVGMMDAIADISGVSLLMDELGAEKVIASPVNTGFGKVRCAHGVLPVPAPATAEIIKGIPVYAGSIEGEMCTPTGAALLKHFVNEYSNMPPMNVERIGYGMGKKDFEAANCVRAFAGYMYEAAEENTGSGTDISTGESADISAEKSAYTDEILELCCNLDDMTAEETGFAIETLMSEGALDVFAVPVMMKKSRMGTLLTILCRQEDKDRIIKLIFKHTTTLGVREKICERSILKREMTSVDTCYGNIRVKVAEGYGVRRAKAEYDDLAKAAAEYGASISEIRDEVMRKVKADGEKA